MDVIGDFITILRNAAKAGKSECVVRWSTLKQSIADILKRNGYIKDFSEEKLENGHKNLKVSLKYVNGVSSITEIGRLGRPGCRMYAKNKNIPQILGGMGIAIVSTSRGIMTGIEAKKAGLGGELMCYVW